MRLGGLTKALEHGVVQRRSTKLSLRSSSGGVPGGSAPTQDWQGQFKEVRDRQGRREPARSGSTWLSAGVGAETRPSATCKGFGGLRTVGDVEHDRGPGGLVLMAIEV